MINRFDGKYLFLSNFYNVPILYNGLIYQNAEAAFHAQKTLNQEERYKFINLQANEAKRLGRQIKLREDWEEIKENVMYEIVKRKFTQNSTLKKMLLDTQEEELIEGNFWHDKYWGVDQVTGVGLNKLGKILMRVRKEIRDGVN